MSRLFNKNNSSPALPLPTDKKSPILQPKAMVLPQPISKTSSFKATFGGGSSSPPQSRSQRNSLNLSQVLGLSQTITPPTPKAQPVFGSPLQALLAFDSAENDEQVVPFLVEECIMYLNREEILKSEGLFRQSGKSTEVQDIKRSYDACKYITLFNVADPHVVTGLFKLYLRSLPEPLIPYTSYDAFIQYQKTVPKSGDVDKLRKLIDEIPLQNKILLKFLCLILRKASSYEKQNKMNANSLAIVIGPNIMRSEHTDMMKAMEESPLINFIAATMIETADILFTSPELCLYDLNFFVIKRKQTPPVYPSFEDFKVKVEERKKTRSFLSNWFSKRSKPEELVKKKIFTDSDMASFRNSKDYSHP